MPCRSLVCWTLWTNRISTITASAYYDLNSIQIVDFRHNHILFTEDFQLLSLSSMNVVSIIIYGYHYMLYSAQINSLFRIIPTLWTYSTLL